MSEEISYEWKIRNARVGSRHMGMGLCGKFDASKVRLN